MAEGPSEDATFGTDYKFRQADSGQCHGGPLPVDYAANAASLGALAEAREQSRTTVIVVEIGKECRVPGYECWWDVPIAEVSEVGAVRRARAEYENARKQERYFF